MKIIYSTLTFVFAATLFAQAQKHTVSVTVKDSVIAAKDTVPDKPVVTYHTINVNGKSISYKATAGYMPMRDTDDKLLAKVFYVAYTSTNSGLEKAKLPVTFVFN